MAAEIIPVILGGDMNCYSMARTFHEAYGVCTHAFGRYAMGETKYSRIIKFTAIPNVDEDEVMLETLRDFAQKHPGGAKILLGCTDDYCAMIIRNRDILKKDYIVPYIGEQLMKRLENKADFYSYCDEFEIPYPKTVVLKSADDVNLLDDLPFEWPVVLKPASSIKYWKFPFDGMKKVYMPKTAEEAKKNAKEIFSAGYNDTLVVQDKIPGADDGMRVLTAYCGRDGKVKMMCLGHVLLEEHTPKAIGNHAAILTEYNRPLMDKICGFLEAIEYTGFANFDIKYDPRDGEYKVFEINLRQGRSNYYVTGAGLNLAKYLVQDYVEKKDFGEPLFFNGEAFWHSIPLPVVWDYTADEGLVKKAKAIANAGKDTTTLGYKYDLRFNPMRWLYLKEHNRRYYKKYETYCEKPQNRG